MRMLALVPCHSDSGLNVYASTLDELELISDEQHYHY